MNLSTLLRCGLLSVSLAAPAFADVPPNPPAKTPSEAEVDQRPRLDVVFVLDTTGSMGGLLEGAKQKIWSIASRLASGKPTPRIRVGLVGYRDRNDEYVTKRFDLTDDLDAVYSNLQGFQAGGGGDGPEHVGQGLGEAVSLMSWSPEKRAGRMIFLVGDAPAHDDYQDQWNTRTWAKKAIEKGIVVNTVRCGGDVSTESLFRELARLADGSFVSIGQAGGMVAVATPYDEEMSKLSAAITDRTLVAGSLASRSAGKVELDALKGMGAGSSADRASYRAKAMPAAAPAPEVKAVGAITLNAAPEKVNALRDEELPEAVRAQPKEKREAFVRQQTQEQEKLQTELNTLSKKRDDYLKANASKKADSFDEQVFEGVKKTAAKVGVAY